MDSFWTPTEKQIADLEQGLGPYLDTNSPHPIESPLTSFGRQYVGFVQKGKRYIYGNFYPTVGHGKDAAEKPVMVCDGGSLYWGIVYDVDSKTFRDLSFNGEA